MKYRVGFRLDVMVASSARLAAGGFLVLAAVVLAAPRAQALPSFARQTGQPCGACHTDFPALTPFGRGFKLRGYTIGGGPFRTTLFPSADEGPKANAKMAELSSFVDDLTDGGKKRLPLSMESIPPTRLPRCRPRRPGGCGSQLA